MMNNQFYPSLPYSYIPIFVDQKMFMEGGYPQIQFLKNDSMVRPKSVVPVKVIQNNQGTSSLSKEGSAFKRVESNSPRVNKESTSELSSQNLRVGELSQSSDISHKSMIGEEETSQSGAIVESSQKIMNSDQYPSKLYDS